MKTHSYYQLRPLLETGIDLPGSLAQLNYLSLCWALFLFIVIFSTHFEILL